MFTRILIGYDGSAEAGAALRLAQTLGRPDATFIVAHVVDGERRSPTDDPVLSAARAQLPDVLDIELCASAGSGVATELHRVAEETMCDLLVVGASRHRGAGRVLLGSNTEATLHGAPCAVAVSTPDPLDRVGRVGVAFDGTAAGGRTVTGAARLAATFDASLTVLGVVDTRQAYASFGAEGGYGDVRIRARALMAEAVAGIHGLPRVERQLREGDPVQEVVRLGRDCDLLVVGARANGLVLRLLLGSVSGKIVRRAACPVLVLPSDVPVPAEHLPVPVTLT